MAHHGSLSSTSIPFIVKSKPKYSIISCGLKNRFNHPNKYIVNRLKNMNSEILRTDMQGAFIFESDGEKLNLIDWK